MSSNHVTARQSINVQILEQLLRYARNHPDQRFGQILRNTGAIAEQELEFVPDPNRPELKHKELVWANEFYLEPSHVLARMNEEESDG